MNEKLKKREIKVDIYKSPIAENEKLKETLSRSYMIIPKQEAFAVKCFEQRHENRCGCKDFNKVGSYNGVYYTFTESCSKCHQVISFSFS